MLRFSSLALVCLFTLPAFGQDATPASTGLIKQAEAAYQAKRFSESASLYTRALPLVQDSDRAEVEYSLAGSQALSGDSASAFKTLAFVPSTTVSRTVASSSALVSSLISQLI